MQEMRGHTLLLTPPVVRPSNPPTRKPPRWSTGTRGQTPPGVGRYWWWDGWIGLGSDGWIWIVDCGMIVRFNIDKQTTESIYLCENNSHC